MLSKCSASASDDRTRMSNYESVDFFTDESLLEDPYPYFEHLRSKCPVVATPHYGVVAVSGYDEATEIYRNNDTFSSCNSVIGPFAAFPDPLEGDDVSEIIDQNRDQLPMNEHMVTMDGSMHARERALLMRLITPKRLKDNEAFMWNAVDRQLDEFIGDGHCEFISAYAQPFAMLVVADVLGVPEADHQSFREFFGLSANPGKMRAASGEAEAADDSQQPLNALDSLDQWFATYLEDRRREPRRDVLTDLALAKYTDGSTPDVASVVRTATFLFAAGQETTARLLATGLKYLAENPELQDELRAHRERIPRARSRRISGWPDERSASAAWTSRRARPSCCSTERPTGTRGASSARPTSASTVPTPKSTWLSAVAPIPVPAVH
jgi:cytochrome P450